MATGQNRTENRIRTGRSAYRNSSYVYGNTVRKLDVTTVIEDEPVRRLSNTARKNREKAARMSLGYVAFLVLAMSVAAAVLIGYIKLQAENTMAEERISAMESELNELRLKNNEEYSRAVSDVDLEEIKRIAIDELGMQYAEKGQIITVEGAKDDYVRQYTDMP